MKLAEWQAILASYGILLVVTEAGAGQLAVIMAWGIALVYLADTLSGGSSVLSGLFPAQQAPAGPNQTSGG